MTDQHDRDVESQKTEETIWERAVDEDARRRHEAAERLKRDPLPEPAETD